MLEQRSFWNLIFWVCGRCDQARKCGNPVILNGEVLELYSSTARTNCLEFIMLSGPLDSV